MKAFLDREYWKWQAGDRRKNLILFSEYLSVEYGALSAWMNGTRKPNRENVDKLSEKLGLEVYDIAGYARPMNGSGVEPRIYAKFTEGWRKLPPDLQRDIEDFFSTITPEELQDFIADAIRFRREHGRRSADDSGESRRDEKSETAHKGQEKKKIALRPGAEKT